MPPLANVTLSFIIIITVIILIPSSFTQKQLSWPQHGSINWNNDPLLLLLLLTFLILYSLKLPLYDHHSFPSLRSSVFSLSSFPVLRRPWPPLQGAGFGREVPGRRRRSQWTWVVRAGRSEEQRARSYTNSAQHRPLSRAARVRHTTCDNPTITTHKNGTNDPCSATLTVPTHTSPPLPRPPHHPLAPTTGVRWTND